MKNNNFLLRPVRFAALLLSAALLQACTMGGQILKEAKSSSGLNKGEVVIVGSIEVTPRLAKDEQSLSPSGVIFLGNVDNVYRNRAMIQLNNQAKESDYKTVITPELGKTFFFNLPRDMKYMVDGSVVMELSKHGVTGKIVLPTWFKIDIRSGDSAVYIGKIKYHRDDFNSITSMKLVDDYAAANRAFKKRFGSKYKLRKALLSKI